MEEWKWFNIYEVVWKNERKISDNEKTYFDRSHPKLVYLSNQNEADL